jgi:hypothetical protein
MTSGAVLGTSGSLTATLNPSSGTYFSAAVIQIPVTQLTLGSNGIVAAYSGDANYTASAASAPVVVSCTAGCGNGTGQTLGLSLGGSAPATVASTPGSTSTTIVSVNPGGGFRGAVNLTCSVVGTSSGDVNIPTCSFNPATVTITNAQAAQSTLTVTTTAANTTAAAGSYSGIGSAVRGGAMLACLLLFGLPGRRRSLALFRVILCGVALGGMLACGGSANGGSTSAGANAASGTTPDTYTVTLRAVDATGTLTAQDSFTISVN